MIMSNLESGRYKNELSYLRSGFVMIQLTQVGAAYLTFVGTISDKFTELPQV